MNDSDCPPHAFDLKDIDNKQVIPQPNVEFLTCSICYLIFAEPVTLPCGHTFCRSCILNAYSCPLCKAGLMPKRASALKKNTIIAGLVDELIVKCPSITEDEPPLCNEEMKVKDLESHAKVCPRIRLLCLCDDAIPRENYFSASYVCDCPSLACQYCQATFQERLLSAHVKKCREEEIHCSVCDGTYKRKNKENHLLNFCFQECPFSQIGCAGKKVKSSEFQHHMSKAYYEHFFLTMRRENPEAFKEMKKAVQMIAKDVGETEENEVKKPVEDESKIISLFFRIGRNTLKKEVVDSTLIQDALEELAEEININSKEQMPILRRENSLAVLKKNESFRDQGIYEYETLEVKIIKVSASS